MGILRVSSRPALVVAALSLAACSADEVDAGSEAAATSAKPVTFTTAQSVRQLLTTKEGRTRASVKEIASTFAALSPPIKVSDAAPLKPWDFLRPMGALGQFGPAGPYGPLGLLGPVADAPDAEAPKADEFLRAAVQAFKPSEILSKFFFWGPWAAMLTEMGGPLSHLGPLGSTGPLNPASWNALEASLPEQMSAKFPDPWGSAFQGAVTKEFVTHLRPGGVFGALGPVGILGALGPLGPLGPLGATGAERNENGEYVSGGKVLRSVDVDWDAAGACARGESAKKGAAPSCRTYEVVEVYPESFAKKMASGKEAGGPNDTSFVVSGTIEGSEKDEFSFVSADAQWVTVAVVPLLARHAYHQAIVWTPADFAVGPDFKTPLVYEPCRSALAQGVLNGYEPPETVVLPNMYLPNLCALNLFGLPQEMNYDLAASFDDFDLDVSFGGTKLSSQSRDMVEWAQIRVPAGTTLKATVSLHKAWSPGDYAANAAELPSRPTLPFYRLVVVGSTRFGVTEQEFTGPFVKP